MQPEIEISLYRGVSKRIPGAKDYKSPLERGRRLPDDASDEDREGWGGLSAWDTPELAHEAAKAMLSAKWVVRYDIPKVRKLRYKPSPPPGHYHIWADAEELHGYLAPGFAEEVRREEAEEQ